MRAALFSLGLALAGCSTAPAGPVATQGEALRAELHGARYQLPYGSEPGQVGFLPAAQESLAEGPSALAIDPQGVVLVLDRRNERVLALEDGVVRSRAAAPADAELIAVGADGTMALYSALHARVRLVDAGGASLGELEVPRVLRGIVSLAVGTSRRVEVSNGFQDSFTIGSPSFPLSLPSVMSSKEEGGPRADGARVRVRKAEQGLIVELVEPRGEWARPRRRIPLRGPGDAARVIGVDGDVAVLRVETLAGSGAVEVSRRVVAVDLENGEERLAIDLPPPGDYLPHDELAVGKGRLAFMRPGPAGLEVSVYAIPRRGAR